MLERALSGKVFQSEKVVQNMNRVIELQKKNFIVRDLAHAQKLVDSYLEVTGDN